MEQKSFTSLEERFTPGDIVRTGPNSHPRYRVVAVSQDKVWLRNLSSGADAVVDCTRCEVIEAAEGSTGTRAAQHA